MSTEQQKGEAAFHEFLEVSGIMPQSSSLLSSTMTREKSGSLQTITGSAKLSFPLI
jgi:hypothetical protein